MNETTSAFPVETPESEEITPETRKCLKHSVSPAPASVNCPLCRSYALARGNVEKAQILFVKRPKKHFPVIEPETEAEPIYNELPLFNEKYYERLIKTFGHDENEYIN
jgi:hypothetical protein